MKTTLTGILLSLSLVHAYAQADEEVQTFALKDIPTEETAFVDSIHRYSNCLLYTSRCV